MKTEKVLLTTITLLCLLFLTKNKSKKDNLFLKKWNQKFIKALENNNL